MVQKKAFGGGALIRFDDHQNKFFLGILIPSFWNWCSSTLKMAAGSFLFCRKQDFHEIGGFPETMYAGEELGFVRKLKKLNRHSSEKFHILENPPVITSSRKLKWYGNMQMAFYLALLFCFPLSCAFSRNCVVFGTIDLKSRLAGIHWVDQIPFFSDFIHLLHYS